MVVDYSRFADVEDSDEEREAELLRRAQAEGTVFRQEDIDPRTGHVQFSLDSGLAALKAAQQAGDDSIQATVHRLLCKEYLRLGDTASAKKHGEKAVLKSRDADDDNLVAGANSDLAMVNQVIGDYDTAEACHTLALRRYRATGQQREEALELIGLGHCSRERAQLVDAGQRYTAAEAIAIKLNDPELLEGIANAALDLKEMAASIGQLQANEAQRIIMEQQQQAAEAAKKAGEGSGAPPPNTDPEMSFAERAAKAGWAVDDNGDDSDDDILGGTSGGGGAAYAPPVGRTEQDDALDAAMAGAASMIAKLRLEGRHAEADHLQAMMAESDDDDDDDDGDGGGGAASDDEGLAPDADDLE